MRAPALLALPLLGCATAAPFSGERAEARSGLPLPIDQAAADAVGGKRRDRTDWKVIALRGFRPAEGTPPEDGLGVLRVELRWEDGGTDLSIDAFDEAGTSLAGSPDALGGPRKRLFLAVDRPGAVHLRIRAAGPGRGSAYTVAARWEGRSPLAAASPPDTAALLPPEDQAPGETASDPARPQRPERSAPATRNERGETVEGRVVSSYREGAGLMLHLDKGSAARVQVGQGGTILEGPAGAAPLPGGGFTIVQVVDGGRSVARAALRALGRNHRVAIRLGTARPAGKGR